MQIIPFEGASLPAHLRTTEAAAANSDLTSHAGGGFPVISIKGKVFAIVRDGERKVLPNPKDPESPATSIDVVLVKANKNVSKVFYLGSFTEGAEAKKPDCYSNDGVKPEDDSEHKQSPMCATCKNNVWGSKVSADGQGGKGKACQDAVRMAVAMPTLVNDPYLIRVPPASIRAVGELGSTLAKRGVSYQAVITRISFVQESATPQLTFKPMAFIDEPTYRKVIETADSDIVQSILGKAPIMVVEKPVAPVQPVKAPTVTVEEVKAVVEAVAKPVVEKPTATAGFAIDLDNLKFDD